MLPHVSNAISGRRAAALREIYRQSACLLDVAPDLLLELLHAAEPTLPAYPLEKPHLDDPPVQVPPEVQHMGLYLALPALERRRDPDVGASRVHLFPHADRAGVDAPRGHHDSRVRAHVGGGEAYGSS